MKELMKTTGAIPTEGKELAICYRLFEQSGEGASHFGVAVEDQYTGECAVVEDVTTRRERAEQLLNLLERGQVTPVSLLEIVEDFVAEP